MAGPVTLMHPDSSTVDTAPPAKVRPSADAQDSSRSTTPRQDSSLLNKLKTHAPPSLQARATALSAWLRGPDPPKPWKTRPFLPRLQQLPLRFVDKFLPRQWQCIAALFLFYVCWVATFAAVLRKSSVFDNVNGYGQPLSLSCGSVFWSENNNCGLNGTSCLPFDDSSFAFRCAANCLSEEALNVRAVGAQEVIYEPLVIGGPTNGASDFVYRGDSFICSAAIHAGAITNSQGGCGVVSLIGQQSSYPSVTRNGISSIAFDASFPSSFTFQTTTASCRDLSWQLLAVSVVYTSILSLFTRSPSVFFYSIVIGCFLQAALATDKPSNSDVATLVSEAIGDLLPALFIAMVMYKLYVRRTLDGLTAQLEKTVLWLGPCWVATLADYTFELIPLQRLTPHDIRQEPGALASLIIIVLVIFFVFIGQAWAFQREGRLLRYLCLYVGLGTCIGLLAAIPNEELRIHHYILAILLLPGTSVQTRPSLVYQGILVGLFINGIAKWGFDPILQTAEQLQGDALLGTVIPSITALGETASNITFTWDGVPAGYAGTSILVNDVERYRDYNSSQAQRSFTWQRMIEGELEYFRFAYFALSAAYGLETGDYTKAGTWYANGTWQQMTAGSI